VASLTVDAKKSSVAGKLLKTYKKDGAQFGVIELTITIVPKEFETSGQAWKGRAGSQLVAKVTADTCIDGSVPTQDVKMEMSMDVTLNMSMGGTAKGTGAWTWTEKRRAVRKE
jgi:hypothetical protein